MSSKCQVNVMSSKRNSYSRLGTHGRAGYLSFKKALEAHHQGS